MADKNDKKKIFDKNNPKEGSKGQGKKKGTVNPTPGKETKKGK